MFSFFLKHIPPQLSIVALAFIDTPTKSLKSPSQRFSEFDVGDCMFALLKREDSHVAPVYATDEAGLYSKRGNRLRLVS